MSFSGIFGQGLVWRPHAAWRDAHPLTGSEPSTGTARVHHKPRGKSSAEPAVIPSTQLGFGVVGRGTEDYFSTLARCVVVDSIASTFL